MKYFSGFEYADFSNAKGKWIRAPLTDLEKLRFRFNNLNFCKSIARYNGKEHQENELMLNGIVLDLDNDDFNIVLAEACLLRDFFFDGWNLQKEEVRFFYSGNRSIHIEIQPETLGIQPHECLYMYIREVVRAITDRLELETVDFSLYAKRHLLRCVGALHSKTNRYKIEIDPSELNLPPEVLKQIATINRGYLYLDDTLELSKNNEASRFFNEIFEIVKQSIDEANFRSSKIENFSIMKGLSKNTACVQDLLDNNIRKAGTRNRATLTLITFYKDAGKSKKEIKEILTPWTKAMPARFTGADEQKRLVELDSLINYVFSDSGKEYHFACPFILSLGSEESPIPCKSRCKLHITKEMSKKLSATPSKIIATAFLPEIGGFLVDLVYDAATKKALFALYDPLTDKVKYVDELSVEHPTIYVPYIDDNVHKGSVLLPLKAEEYGNVESLFEEVISFISRYYHEPNKHNRTLDALYIFFTWVYDKFRSCCYLQFIGRAGGGKTRALETLGHLCYRPIMLAGADTAASTLRMLNLYRGTSLMDEATFTNQSEAHTTMVQILNVGYKPNGSVGRCEGEDNKPVRYIVGGPKILATRSDFYDDGLRSRCFVRRTGLDNRIKEGALSQPFVLPKEFEEEALVIRNKLLLWRFRHWKDAKLNPDLEIKGVESRVNEIIVPILSVMQSQTIRDSVEALAREQQEDLKQHRQSSLEGKILKAVQDLGWASGDIHPVELRDKINNENSRDKPLSTHTVTAALKKLELSLHKYGNRYMLTNSLKNKELLNELYRDYDLQETTPNA